MRAEEITRYPTNVVIKYCFNINVGDRGKNNHEKIIITGVIYKDIADQTNSLFSFAMPLFAYQILTEGF